MQFSGQIQVATAGQYTFYTTSDDGSRLWIDGQLVVDNDGLHATQERSGTITLSAGQHNLLVAYFERGGDEALSVAWEGPGLSKQTLPAAVLGHFSATTPPAAPQDLVAIPSVTAINLAWTAAASDVGVAAYEIRRDGVLVGSTAQPYYRDTTAASGQSYVYTVTAVDELGNRSDTVQVSSEALLALASGVVYRTFLGQWSQLPDFGTLVPEQASTVENFSLSVRPGDYDYGLQYFGKLDVPAPGQYTFYTASDDGSRLWIDGNLVVDNDGLHGDQERSGTVTLSAGMHAIRVEHFQRGGGQSLSVSWQGPGLAKQTIGNAALFYDADTQAPTAPPSLQANAGVHVVGLTWGVSLDDWKVTGYEIARDGQLLGTTSQRSFVDTTATAGAAHDYTVVALDAAGNRSVAATLTTGLASLPTGLFWHSYLGQWSQLPDFGTLQPAAGGTAANFDIGVAQRDVDYALLFTGKIEIQQAGNYTFYTNSDDGNRLWIDGQQVVDNDGLHGTQERSGSITLSVGMHTVTLGFFQLGGGQSLAVSWEGPGFTKQALGDSVLYRDLDTQAPTSPQNLVLTALAGSVCLAWSPSQDDVTVAGYRVLRNGQLIGTAAQTFFRDVNAARAGGDVYTVVSVDEDGNASAASQPATSAAMLDLPTRLVYRSYAGQWSQMPDFAQLLPEIGGTVADFNIGVRQHDNDYALWFGGQLEVPATGAYTFYTSSDDGSCLWIDGQLVVDNDGLHAAQERSGQIALGVGMHTIAVGYFQGGWDQSLAVSWAGPGIAKQAIAGNVLFHNPDAANPTAPQNVTAVGLASGVRLSWDLANDDLAVTGYRIRRDGQQIAFVTQPHYADATAVPGAAHAYTVAAVDVAGKEAAGQQVSATRPAVQPGLLYRYYTGQWANVPEFASLTPAAVGVATAIDLSMRQQDTNYALQFTGQLEVAAAGTYTFYTNSDDASLLWIDGQLIVDNDGLHQAQERSGSVTLSAGMHSIAVAYTQAGGEQLLSASWEGPGINKQAIPASTLFWDSHAAEFYLVAPSTINSGSTLELVARPFDLAGNGIQSVSFYRDTNGNGTIDAGDQLWATDTDGSDGWSAVVSTAAWPVGSCTILAQATFGSGTAVLEESATAAVRLPLTWSGGNGTWDATSAVWQRLDGTFQAWQTDAEAVFSGTPATISISGDVSARKLIFTTGGFILQPATDPSTDRLLVYSGGTTIDVRASATPTTINAVIAGSNPADILLKTGPGTLILAAQNTYPGETAVAGGVLKLSADNALPTGGM